MPKYLLKSSSQLQLQKSIVVPVSIVIVLNYKCTLKFKNSETIEGEKFYYYTTNCPENNVDLIKKIHPDLVSIRRLDDSKSCNLS
jgi:hypothetical protein